MAAEVEQYTITAERLYYLYAVEEAARSVAGIIEDVNQMHEGLLTCQEAENIAHLFDLLEDGPERAERFLADHARGDDDPDDAHYELGQWVQACDVERINRARLFGKLAK